MKSPSGHVFSKDYLSLKSDMIISILGCGWLGMPLAEMLIARGHHVNGSTTTVEKVYRMTEKKVIPYVIDIFASGQSELAESQFFHCEVVVVAIPPKGKGIYSEMMKTLVNLTNSHSIKKIIFISSTSVYGKNSHRVDEDSDPQPTTPNGKMILDCENILLKRSHLTTHCVRLGGLVGPGRFPGYFFSGGDPVPDGLAPINLIHLSDAISIIVQLIEGSYRQGTINAVTPHHPTRSSFFTMAARAAGQPIPEFVQSKGNWKLVTSKYLDPALHYEFKISNWFVWLSRIPKDQL